jgi:Fur family ferric uptake transcriptional regulator
LRDNQGRMTDSPDVPPLLVADPDEAVQALRDSGLRLSTARRLLIEALFAAEGPVSAAQLSRRLRIDESSVYRNLEVLERHGLIRHLHLGHGPGLYLLAARDDAEYLYCEACEKVTAVSPGQLDPVRRQIHDRFGYTARFTHFAIVGVCEDCAARGARPGAAARHH